MCNHHEHIETNILDCQVGRCTICGREHEYGTLREQLRIADDKYFMSPHVYGDIEERRRRGGLNSRKRGIIDKGGIKIC